MVIFTIPHFPIGIEKKKVFKFWRGKKKKKKVAPKMAKKKIFFFPPKSTVSDKLFCRFGV
jgi:hypothetical protein